MCTQPQGGYRIEIRLDHVLSTRVYTEEGGSESDGEELIIGKKSGTGLRMSALRFPLEDLLRKQQDENIWIYQSFIRLTLKDDSKGSDPWKSQITELRPLAVEMDDVSTSSGQLTSEQNLEEKTGEFREIVDKPNRKHQFVVAEFTETIQSWISPFNKNKNKYDNHGVAIVNTYTDGSSERTNAMDVRYYDYTNNTDLENYIPWIDVCYKAVEIPRCTPPYKEISADVVAATVLVKGENGNRNNETLTHGQDLAGTTYMSVIKFDLDQFSQKFKSYSINQSYIHLHYLGPSDGPANHQRDRRVYIHKITEDWDEENVSWDTIKYAEKPSGSILIEKERLGGTEVIIPVHHLAKHWIDNGVDNVNFGVVLIDSNEDAKSLLPQYVDDDDTDPDHYHPRLAICQKEAETSSSSSPLPTTTIPTGTTKVVTQTTPTVGKVGGCARKIKTPVGPVTVAVIKGTNEVVNPDNTTEEIELCVSDEPIEQAYCWDIAGVCKKLQRRNIYGKIETECDCCLPLIKKGEAKAFECKPSKRRIEIELEYIEMCNCMECVRERGGNSNAGENNVLENISKRGRELSAGDKPPLLYL